MSKLSVKFSQENAQTCYIKTITTGGLATYARDTGYVAGITTVAWAAHTIAQDRGIKLNIDALDSKEAMTSILEIAATFTKQDVIPEIDAYRFEKLCTLAGLDVSANLTYDTALAAIDTGIAALDDAEVPVDGRVLFVSNAMYALLKQGDPINIRIATATSGVLNREILVLDGMPLIRVPTGRFCNNFDFSATDGFSKATGSKNLNFVIADKNSIAAVTKYAAPKIVDKDDNQTADAYLFGYRTQHDLFVQENKKSAVYIHAESDTN